MCGGRTLLSLLITSQVFVTKEWRLPVPHERFIPTGGVVPVVLEKESYGKGKHKVNAITRGLPTYMLRGQA